MYGSSSCVPRIPKQITDTNLLILQFVKSCRTADFSLYMETLDSLMPWVFALDHTHYARNLPIHLRDMATLEERHPALYVEFQRGHFMGQKSMRSFSNIQRDQMHEQLIDWLKNHAGVIENLDDPKGQFAVNRSFALRWLA